MTAHLCLYTRTELAELRAHWHRWASAVTHFNDASQNAQTHAELNPHPHTDSHPHNTFTAQ